MFKRRRRNVLAELEQLLDRLDAVIAEARALPPAELVPEEDQEEGEGNDI